MTAFWKASLYVPPQVSKEISPPWAPDLAKVKAQVTSGNVDWDAEYLAVVKGAPHKENAFKFVSYALRPEAQAPLVEQLGYNPNSKKSLRTLSDSARKWLPDSNNPRDVILNDSWWADNFETISRRFKEWILT